MSLHRLTILRAISLSACVVTLGCDGTAPTTEQSTSNMAPAAAVAVKLQLNWVAEPEFGGFYEADPVFPRLSWLRAGKLSLRSFLHHR